MDNNYALNYPSILLDDICSRKIRMLIRIG